MTAASRVLSVASFSTSLELLTQLQRFPLSALRNTLGPDGKVSQTALRDILTQWYVTSSRKEQEKFWTLIVVYFTPLTPPGALSPDLN
jgi:hypothetical protein